MSKNRREYLTLHLSYRHPLHFVKHLCPDQTGNLNVTPKYLSALSHESEVVFFISILCGAQDNLFLLQLLVCRHLTAVFLTIRLTV